MPGYLLKFCSFYLCFIITYGNAWEEGETLLCHYLYYLMIIWLPERVSDTVHLSVAHQLPGELWGVTLSPSFLFLASNELWLTDKSRCDAVW